MAKYLASEASWEAANAALDTFGGFGFAAEYDIERKFRETRLYKTAPVNNNLVQAFVAQHVLGLPRSLLSGGPGQRPDSAAPRERRRPARRRRGAGIRVPTRSEPARRSPGRCAGGRPGS